MSRRNKQKVSRKDISRHDPVSANISPMFSDWSMLDPTMSDRHLGTVLCTYHTLNSMARVPLIAALVQTRINQVAEFAHPQPSPFSIGYRIVPVDPMKPLSRRDRVAMGAAYDCMHTAGDTYFLGGFEAFLKTVVRDTLTLDQVNFEVLRTRSGAPYGFVPVDPTTIRRAVPSKEQLADYRWDSDETGYVQVIDYEIVSEFAFRDLAWGIRRPRSSIRANGYGFPELEELIGVVANLVNAITYNSVNFTTGLNAHTLITLNSKMARARFQEAERLITAGLSGIRNSKRIPVIQLDPMLDEELKVHLLGKSNDEMQYGEWVNFLLKQICALFGMDPTELNFIFGNEGVKNQLKGEDPSGRVTTSRERGLRPLLRSISTWINYWIIQETWPQFRFEFAGFDSQTEADKLDMDNKAVQFWESPNAVRRSRGKTPFPHLRAEYPLHPSFDAIFQQAQGGGGMQPPMQNAGTMGDWMSGNGLPDPNDPGAWATSDSGSLLIPRQAEPATNPLLLSGPA